MKKYWLAINTIPDLGPVTVKKLWEHFGSIEAVWRADENAIQQIDGLNQKAAKAFIRSRPGINPEELEAKLEGTNIRSVCLEDRDYPELLRNIYDPPPVLYYQGQLPKHSDKTIAIVGTRRPTRYGLEFARKLAFELAQHGLTVVSGLASGIDTAAHKGALEAKGKSLAVFGCGVDIIYPSANRQLADDLVSSGALVSEFPPGTGTEKGNFPRRNRIIAGLSLGTIVIEGHYKSGAMITAKEALDQGREVFAVPGQAGLEQSMGPHWLIKQGAKLVESVEDVLEELNLEIRKLNVERRSLDYSSLTADEQKMVGVLTNDPKSMDIIALETKLSIPQVSSLLMMLELKKIIRQLPGKMFVLAVIPANAGIQSSGFPLTRE